jgi:DNA-binding HxlR family transcriptional regulator/peroxiredoxin
MPRQSWRPEAECAIAQTVSVLGDGWSLLVVRDVARGLNRFDELAEGLAISRKVLTERLARLVEQGVLTRTAYQDRPVRYEYRLTPRGRALLPVLVAMQDWGDRWLLGDGELTGTSGRGAPDAARVRGLVGRVLPPLALPSTVDSERCVVDPDTDRTVLFGYPATGTPTPLPEGWSSIPGALGCTLENRLFRDAFPRFVAAGVAVHGVSTQRPDEQRAMAAAEAIPFPLLSDQHLELTAALRLPTFRAADVQRIKRVVLVLDRARRVLAVRYPVTDIEATVEWALKTARRRRAKDRAWSR